MPRPEATNDDDNKKRALTRLRRIEGQVRGLQRMVEDDRYCADVLQQIESAQEALRGVAREILREHLRHCAAKAFAAGGERREEMVEELVGLALPK
jgi:DNA-binding FrmR family transcriptional regulator